MGKLRACSELDFNSRCRRDTRLAEPRTQAEGNVSLRINEIWDISIRGQRRGCGDGIDIDYSLSYDTFESKLSSKTTKQPLMMAITRSLILRPVTPAGLR